MSRHCTLALAALLCAGITSPAVAQQRPRPYPLTAPADWQIAVTNGTRSKSGTPGQSYWRHDLTCRIEAELEPAAARVRGRVTWTMTNRSPTPLGELVVHLRQNLHRGDALRNVPVELTGGMDVDLVRIDDRTLPSHQYQRDGTLLQIELPRPLAPLASTALSIHFACRVPAVGRAPRMGHENHDTFILGYWYPQLAVHDDLQGWHREQYLGASEFYMPFADYELQLTAPVGFVVQATGELQNQERVLTENARRALAAALDKDEIVHVVDGGDLEAGGLTATDPTGKLTWRFAAKGVRDCAVGVSSRWLWDATHADVTQLDGTQQRCLIHAFYRPRARTWRRAAQYARHAIEFGSAQLLPYPWPQMSLCEGIVDGGMEYPMMTAIGVMPSAFAQQSLTAHELLHMWFPMQVGSNEKQFAWLDEGLTDFATDHAEADFWQRDEPHERALAEFRNLTDMGADAEPMMRHGDHYLTEMGYSFASYTKPKAMLHQLAGMLGRDRVFAALRAYAAAWRGKHPTPHDFFRMMNTELGQDLDWYWRTWCFETWRLDQAIDSVEVTEAGTRVVIRDLGTAPHPTTVRATFGDDTTAVQTVPVEHWLGGADRAEVTFDRPAVLVVIDPSRTTLDVQPKNNYWER